jgi:hypothetical protein
MEEQIDPYSKEELEAMLLENEGDDNFSDAVGETAPEVDRIASYLEKTSSKEDETVDEDLRERARLAMLRQEIIQKGKALC